MAELSAHELSYEASFNEGEGWLNKQGGMVKSWKRRYMLVKDGWLVYYKTVDDAKAAANRKGRIKLEESKLVVFDPKTFDRNWCFGLTPKDSARTYILEAATSTERLSWIKYLTQFGAQIRAQTLSSLLMNSKREEEKAEALSRAKAASMAESGPPSSSSSATQI